MPHYTIAQVLGAFLGAALTFANYYEALEAYGKTHEGGMFSIPGTAGIFAPYPEDFLSLGGGFLDQVIGTAFIAVAVCAVGDPKNMAVPPALVPLYVLFTIVGVGTCFGFNCGYAVNPARDLGPRLFTLVAGWGKGVFTIRDSVWWIIPITGPYVGAIVGAVLYSVFIEAHWPREELNDSGEREESRSVEAEEVVTK